MQQSQNPPVSMIFASRRTTIALQKRPNTVEFLLKKSVIDQIYTQKSPIQIRIIMILRKVPSIMLPWRYLKPKITCRLRHHCKVCSKNRIKIYRFTCNIIMISCQRLMTSYIIFPQRYYYHCLGDLAQNHFRGIKTLLLR